MKLFITGSTGYIGHQLALRALSQGYKVNLLVRDPASANIPSHQNISLFKGDVTDKGSVLIAMKDCEYVMHAAGVVKYTEKDKGVFYKVNVEGTRNVLDAAIFLGIKRFVFTSTGGVIGPSGKHPMSEDDPRITAFENDYEVSKYWAEELVKEYSNNGLHTVIVAAPRVYGPGLNTGGNPFHKLLQRILSTRIAFVPSFDHVMANYVFIDDVVNGHFLALAKGKSGEKYILGGENISYKTFFETIKACSGNKVRLIPIHQKLLFAWSFLYNSFTQLMGHHTDFSPALVRRIIQNRALTSEKAVHQLGYTITPFTEGIQKTIKQLKTKHYEK